jgi:hypothetical protein
MTKQHKQSQEVRLNLMVAKKLSTPICQSCKYCLYDQVRTFCRRYPTTIFATYPEILPTTISCGEFVAKED